ncbi:Cytochrome P450 [Colletotrichum higginsianum IMI 349063]|uniref:Cytochrome P450 n=2 Tax=Colletotrichum higginsianum TaxID=80884 RepID=A0A1B7YNV2_COLHI|nr:Cytochrome P450 [Colletotrichum higginsianum IMI 349063]OBR13689.1 Cytochrome P450 [Colletotrichum higginsianum IMI 349063]TID01716.1 Cytochrome P450 monooxygenase yanC [Colletotrichum higginsianum]
MTSSSTSTLLGAVALATVLFVLSRIRRGSPPRKPLKLPIIGDLHSSPRERPLLNWDEWARTNGPVAASKLFGIVPMVVLNTSAAATELFAKRSARYSNRPSSVSMEMITGSGPGKSRFTLMHDYDADLKLHHRMLSPSLGAVAAPRYQPLMELESKQFLVDLLSATAAASAAAAASRGGKDDDDDAVMESTEIHRLFERTQASVILGLHYGIRVPSVSDPVLSRIVDVHEKVTHVAANPSLVDFVPPLRHLPAFLSPWRRAADRLFRSQSELYLFLLYQGMNASGWNATRQARAVAAKHAGDAKGAGVPEMDLAFTLATSVQGGMETAPRQMMWLLVAAHANRDFLTRAHAVLDKFVGRKRLPRFADRPRLSYVDAIASEVMRWRPVAPGSIPRRADGEDEILGKRIVEGATLFANSWAIGRDKEVFGEEVGDLGDFVPERWLDVDGGMRTELPLAVFGHGRRSCLGKRVATDNIFMVFASLLWAFEIVPVEEVDTMAMDVAGFMTAPSGFRFGIRPRGPWVEEVIRSSWKGAETDLGRVMGEWSDIDTR